MNDYLSALITAAYHGEAMLPKVTIELCPRCHGFKFRTSYEGRSLEQVVSFANFKQSRFPLQLLLAAIDHMRNHMAKDAD